MKTESGKLTARRVSNPAIIQNWARIPPGSLARMVGLEVFQEPFRGFLSFDFVPGGCAEKHGVHELDGKDHDRCEFKIFHAVILA